MHHCIPIIQKGLVKPAGESAYTVSEKQFNMRSNTKKSGHTKQGRAQLQWKEHWGSDQNSSSDFATWRYFLGGLFSLPVKGSNHYIIHTLYGYSGFYIMIPLGPHDNTLRQLGMDCLYSIYR